VLCEETRDIINDLISVKEAATISFFLNHELYDFLTKINSSYSSNFHKTTLETMDVECLISIGGDGTILRVARSKPDIPILSVNKGRKGFMTEIEPRDVVTSFSQFLAGKFTLEEHHLIEAFINGKKQGLAINEIVITSVDLLKPIDFRLIVDGMLTTGSLADGIIISTAVGSTGHSLSSGGSIVDPVLNNIEISWINPINLAIWPVILAPSREIKIRCSTRINPVKLVFDGQVSLEFKPPIEVVFLQSQKTVRFYRSRHFTKRWRHHLLPDISE